MIKSVTPLGFPWESRDPFLLCVHHRDEFPSGNSQMGVDNEQLEGRNIGSDFVVKDGWRMYHGKTIPGFPHHPHRGFETITIGKQGFVDHTDSLGASGRFGAGDVQWMTAGKGIQHSEMFPLINADKPNPLEIFQVWLNLPASDKFVEPHFQMFWHDKVPVVLNSDANGKITEIDVIAGNINATSALAPTPNSWAANPANKVLILTIKMAAGARWQLPVESDGPDRMLYFYSGKSISIGGKSIAVNHQIRLDAGVKTEIQNGDEEAYFLLLQGKPINEPIAREGPFIMNTDEEIQQAYSDFKKTGFGGWPWPEREVVHDKDKGRFAAHADGSVEQASS